MTPRRDSEPDAFDGGDEMEYFGARTPKLSKIYGLDDSNKDLTTDLSDNSNSVPSTSDESAPPHQPHDAPQPSEANAASTVGGAALAYPFPLATRDVDSGGINGDS